MASSSELGPILQETFEKLSDRAYGDPNNFVHDAKDILTDGHARAANLSRSIASGEDLPLDSGDVWVGMLSAERETRFLHKFEAWLRSGTEDRESQIEHRCRLYVGAIRGTAYEQLFEHKDKRFLRWVLGDAEHCSDCIELSENGPYPSDEMPTWPGFGDTECGAHCHCDLEDYHSGERYSFPRLAA